RRRELSWPPPRRNGWSWKSGARRWKTAAEAELKHPQEIDYQSELIHPTPVNHSFTECCAREPVWVLAPYPVQAQRHLANGKRQAQAAPGNRKSSGAKDLADGPGRPELV